MKIQNGFKWISMTMLFTLLCSCQSNLTKEKRFQAFAEYVKNNNLKKVPQINAFKFQGWEALDNRHLIVLTNQGRSYLLTLITFCNDANFTPNISFKQAIGSRLSTTFDAVVVNDQHCYIKTIHRVNQQQRSELSNLVNVTR